MANEKKHRLRDAIDWARRSHWLWTIFPASGKAYLVGAAVAGVTVMLALIKRTPLPLLFVFTISAVVIYAVGWTVVQKFGPRHKEAIKQIQTFDGEIYRIIIYPTVGDLSFKLLEGKYIASGGNADDVRTDCDVLVEAYIVNRAHAKVFIRDFLLYLEIDGERKRFASTQDFVLEDLFGKSTEYGLQQDDESSREPGPLPSLRKKMLVGFDPGEPLEGWIRFSVASINPRKQYPVAFSVLDSVGEEHPIARMSQSARTGNIALRRVTSVE